MWLLSCSTDLFGGKRLWLRPGSSTLLGRTSAAQEGVRNHYVESSIVSRKHLYLNVSEIGAGDSMKLHAKSTVTAVDGSKTGTFINGHKISKEEKSKTLDEGKYEIKLGSAVEVFTLEWHPIVLSFTTGILKSAKAKGTALAEERAKLEPYGLKLSTEYIPSQTTHAIAKKRNTATVLQALLQGKWVITSSYVDALLQAGKKDPVNEHGSPGLSALERDFDGNWPKEEEHLCPAMPEQKIQSNKELKPDPQRSEMFADYIFVFIDVKQFDVLQPVVNSGNGKAVCYEFEDGSSTAEDVVDYVKQLAGKKGSGQFWLSQEIGPGGIVIVRPAQGHPIRENGILHGVELALDQRAIEQSEFLDAILSIDTSMLRQPLQRAVDSASDEQRLVASSSFPTLPARTQGSVHISDSPTAESQPATRATQAAPQTQEQSVEPQDEQEMPPTATRRRRRFITQTKFQGFDDFDESQIVRPTSQNGPNQQPNQGHAGSSQQMNVDEAPQRTSETRERPQKRPAPIEEEEEEETEEQKHARMFPGQAAYKRRKTEALQKGDKSVPASGPQAEPAKVAKEESAKEKVKKGKEAANALKARMIAEREAEEERYRKEKGDDEKIRQFDSDDIPVIEHKPVVFELPVREPRSSTTVNDTPAWNGRPNYKKFRRKGTARPQIETQPVLIALEEVPGKSSGLGDEYWLENGDMHARHRRKEKSQGTSQSQSQSVRAGGPSASIHDGEGSSRGQIDEEERTAFRRRVQRSREQDEQEEAADAEWNGRASGSTQSTLGTLSQKKAAGKRPASTQLTSGLAKKARPTAIQIGNGDDDDPKAFRRKRR